jgi:hypothetical protein
MRHTRRAATTTTIVTLLVLAVALSTPAITRAQPLGVYVPLQPCKLTTVTTSANTTMYLLARGSCNVPTIATGVGLAVVVQAGAKSGRLVVWESSLPKPDTVTVAFRPNGETSGFTIARLCYPVEECATEDLALSATESARVTLFVTGYLVPPTQ